MKQKKELLTLLLEGVDLNNFDLLYPYMGEIEETKILGQLKRAIENFQKGTGYISQDPQCDTTASHGWTHVNAAVERLQRLAEELRLLIGCYSL